MNCDPADPGNALTALAASVRWRVPGFTNRFVFPKIGARGFPSARVAAPFFSAIQVAPVCPHAVTPEACQAHPPESCTMCNPSFIGQNSAAVREESDRESPND